MYLLRKGEAKAWEFGKQERKPDCESKAKAGIIIRTKVAMSVCFLPQLSVPEDGGRGGRCPGFELD